ncbi:MAG: hypothetical protein AAGA86_09875, partial [Bacteroidota bacterium]
FQLRNRSELYQMLMGNTALANRRQAGKVEPVISFETAVLDILEKKYGQEFKSIQHQLHSLFQDKLEREQKSPDKESDQSIVV